MRSRINQLTVLYAVDEGLHGTVDIPHLAYITLLVLWHIYLSSVFTLKICHSNFYSKFFPCLQPKTLVKPDDQLELTEKELKEEITRVLTADNPHAPDNLIRFNFKENAFKHVPHIDHFAMHFSLDGWVQSHTQTQTHTTCHYKWTFGLKIQQ